MSTLVRPAFAHDVDAIAPLFDAYRQFYGQSADPEGARAFLAARFTRHESVLLVAHRAGTPVGFAQLYPLFSSVQMARTYLLNDLFVVPVARRAGVGRALLEAVARHARGLGAASLSLSTARDNASAQALYASLGWVRDERFCEYSLAL